MGDKGGAVGICTKRGLVSLGGKGSKLVHSFNVLEGKVRTR